MALPRISIITCTFNSNLSLFEQALKAVKEQTYPPELIEHIVMDGGSTNGCVELAKKYKCIVEVDKKLKNKDQVRSSLGIKKAKGKLILILESDNIITSENWIYQMVEPFLKNKKIICTYSAYNSYLPNMSLTTRYCALFGSPDPALYYLKKSEKIRFDEKQYTKGEVLKEIPNYWIVKFTKDTLPTIGDNGHMFLKNVVDLVNKDPEKFIHVDVFAELLKQGYDTFGVVKNSIIHTTNPNIWFFVKRRVAVKSQYYDKKREVRKYFVFNPRSKKDIVNLVKFTFFSLTVLIPFYESVRGYIRIRDTAWFLHPFMCIFMLFGYGYSVIKYEVQRVTKNIA